MFHLLLASGGKAADRDVREDLMEDPVVMIPLAGTNAFNSVKRQLFV